MGKTEHHQCIQNCYYQQITGLGDSKRPVLGDDKSKQRELDVIAVKVSKT